MPEFANLGERGAVKKGGLQTGHLCGGGVNTRGKQRSSFEGHCEGSVRELGKRAPQKPRQKVLED